MAQALALLLVDSHDDRAEAIAAPLRAAGFEPDIVRVPDAQGAIEALGSQCFDVILCRCEADLCAVGVPMLVAHAEGTPILAIADQIETELALEAMRSGVFDWVIAHHLDERLPMAVQRALVSAATVNRERQTRADLEDSERRYRRLVDAMHDGVVAIDQRGTITFANRAMAEMLERPVEELIGTSTHELVDERDADRLEARLRARFEEGAREATTYELRAISGSGRPLTIEITATPLRDEQGLLGGGLGIVRNVTPERRRQEELRSIRIGLDNATDAVIVTDAQRRPIYTNPAFKRLFGSMDSEADTGADTSGVATDPSAFPRLLAQLEATGSLVTELEMNAADGRVFPALIRANLVTNAAGEMSGIVAVITDISALREREERLRLVNRINALLNAGADPERILAVAAEELRRLLHAELALVILRPDPDREPDVLAVEHFTADPEALAAMEEALGRPARGIRLRLAPGEPAALLYEGHDVESVGVTEVARFLAGMPAIDRPDLDPVPVTLARARDIGYMYSVPLEVAGEIRGQASVARRSGQPLTEDERAFVRGFVQQVAIVIDKARTERELLRANQLLEGMIDNVEVWFSVVDEHREIVVWNRAAEQISGYTRPEVHNEDQMLALLYPDPDTRREVLEVLAGFYAGEITSGAFESDIRRKDDETRTIAWSLHRLSMPGPDGGTGMVVVGHDITESRELQERLRRTQRLEAIGTLAGGIAHDFNNVLTAITGYADLLATEVAEDSAAQLFALQIADAAQRGARLTRQLLAFARRQPARPQVVNLDDIIRDMEEILSRLIRQDIELRLRLAPGVGATTIDPTQAEQIIMNLVLNARDAMPEGGTLTIATANAVLSEADTTGLFDARPGSYVTLTVSDTGIGMDEDTQAHIFEPFFTTKTDAGNTGLGLATVYGIVRQNEGMISVYSEPGRGTTIRVYLPRTGAPAPQEEDLASAHRPVGGTETLLVVEDTDSLRELMETMLSQLGYTVFAAPGGAAALALAEEQAGAIDLAIVDVVMPDMSGTQLGERLLDRYPELRVLYVSGYPNEHAITAERGDPRFSFLQKPFSAAELARKVRAVLDADLSLS